MTRLLSGVTPRSEWAARLESATFPPGAFVWVESVEEAHLGGYEGLSKPASGFDSGRVFWPEGELRWESVGPDVRVVYLGEANPPLSELDVADDVFEEETSGAAPEDVEYRLSGEALDYSSLPTVERGGELRLIAVRYAARRGGVAFERFHSVREG